MAGDRQGKCSNVGKCSLADQGKPVVVGGGRNFVCPECGKGLNAFTPAAPGQARRNAVIVMAVIITAVLLGGMLYWRSWLNTEGTRQRTPPRPEVSILAPAGPALVSPLPASAPSEANR